MAAKRTKLGDRSSVIYHANPWYVQVNRKTRKCQVTSGDVWFSVTRREAAKFLRQAG